MPSLEALGILEIQNGPVKVRETKAQDIFSPRQGKKEASSSFSQNPKRVEVASDFWCDSTGTSIRCRMSCT